MANEASPGNRLGVTAARGALATMSGQACKILLQFGGIVILARLLQPSDYGLLAMVVAVVGLGEVLRDFGLSSAVVQARHISNQQQSNLFWINAGIGVILAVCVNLSAPLLANFYDEPLLKNIARVLSVTFLFNGLATQYRAQLNRGLKFGQLAVVDVGSQAVGLAVGVIFALRGLGYWALVGQQVIQTGSALLMLLIASRGWMPDRPRRGADMQSLLRFGWNLMNTQLVIYISRNLDSIIIGNRFGAELLGIYNRAYQLLMLPLNQINSPATTIALPILSSLQGDSARYDAFLIRGQTMLLHLTLAIFSFSCAQAEPLILLVLGKQWAPAVPIFQILAVGGVFQAAGYANYWVFLSKGLTGSHYRFTLVTRALLIGVILIGSHWGITGVAVAISMGLSLIWISGLFWLRASGAPIRSMFANGATAMVAYGVCGTASALAATATPFGLAARLGLGSFAMAMTFLLVCAVWPGFRQGVVAIISSRALLRRN